MLKLIQTITLIFVFIILTFIGCSSNHSDPVMPTGHTAGSITGSADILSALRDIPIANVDEAKTYRQLLGIWTLVYERESNTITSVPYREAMWHFNVTSWVSPPDFVYRGKDDFTGQVDVDATIKNTAPYLTGYDVRLIVYSDNVGNRLMNPDDYTPLFDIPGGAQINPYRAFAKNIPKRAFYSGASHTERLQLYYPAGFQPPVYAIDASWPSNCEEPYEIKNFTQEELYSNYGCKADIHVEVNDWQNNVNSVSLWCFPIIGSGTIPFSVTPRNNWGLTITNSRGASAGDYIAVVTAKSSDSSICLYDTAKIRVSSSLEDTYPPVWDDTIGITEAIPGDGEVTILWGTATDEQTPPVSYLLYKDEDDNPWDQQPIIVYNNYPYTFTPLENGKTYWFGVRCQDSANPPNVDTNTNVLSATPGPLVVIWKRSEIWYGDINGPVDSQGFRWFENNFDDKAWSIVTLPDDNTFPNQSDRFFRTSLNLSDNDPIELYFWSDDGIWIYINGFFIGHWGGEWRKGGCVNNPLGRCGGGDIVPPIVVPNEYLYVGKNVVSVRVSNGFPSHSYFDMHISDL